MNSETSMKQKLQALIDSTVGPAPAVLLGVHAPFMALDWQGAAGEFEKGAGTALTPRHGFRIASMSKTFTGVLAAQLLEQGRLDLEAPIGSYLPADLITQVPVKEGHHVDQITVRNLLNHTAGFNDFALSPEWFEIIASDPGRSRSPQEIIEWALSHGELVGAPGEQYHYSDTGYVLLGLLLEAITSTPYWSLCRSGIFDPLEMDNTWLEGHEQPHCELSHSYHVHEGEYIDALQIHGSTDWAAGGHVSTLTDLDRFLRGVFNGKLFSKIDTLDSFLNGVLAKENYHYGMGVGRKQIHGKTLWGHLGHWGSFMYYCPEERLSFSGTLSYSEAEHNVFIENMLQLLFED
jgi:D-alanyl-D-alanine carboxypeptidase